MATERAGTETDKETGKDRDRLTRRQRDKSKPLRLNETCSKICLKTLKMYFKNYFLKLPPLFEKTTTPFNIEDSPLKAKKS